MSTRQQSLRTRLPSSPASPRLARRVLDETLAEWEREDLLETAELLTSELVTNALVHARPPVWLRITAEPEGVLIAVEDADQHLPRVKDPDPDATGGRGLYLVQELATAWGVEHRPQGKRTWFRLGD